MICDLSKKEWIKSLNHPNIKIKDNYVVLNKKDGTLKLLWGNQFFKENVINFLELGSGQSFAS